MVLKVSTSILLYQPLMLLVLLLCEELASLVEFGAWFDLPWCEGELVICLGFRGSMVFCH
jgi:hypothetical protein